MKMLSHSSLALLSVVTICVCGPQRPSHVAAAALAPEMLSVTATPDSGISPEEIAAAGLGGMDGAVVFSVVDDFAAPAENPGAVLTHSDVRHREPGS
ncbi:MAG: hypothetical protein JWN73_2320 [Betaproteobacteria bacterium]|nr:hypothetical protein [Betaproteobacteria bacterium]